MTNGYPFANQYNIQWFPGHMTKTLRMMEQEIQHVDASLVLLDARIPLSSLNPEIERITARKPKLYALNKADLADPAVTEEWIRYFHEADAAVSPSAPSRKARERVKARSKRNCPTCWHAARTAAWPVPRRRSCSAASPTWANPPSSIPSRALPAPRRLTVPA